jgi:uncharacterized protein YecA (UPF0149 family)
MANLKKDIEKALKKYTSLTLNVSDEIPFIQGVFTAYDKTSNTEIEDYNVLIRFTEKYPYAFPVVIETSKKIPKDLSRHVKGDGTLCFANWQDELSACKNGITFIWFLDEILNTHLCREFVKEKTGNYPTGERSHGIEGIWEGYYDVLSITDKSKVLEELDLILNHNQIGRNHPCYCNKGKKYKACHEKIESEVTKIGKTNAKEILEILKTDFKNKKKIT